MCIRIPCPLVVADALFQKANDKRINDLSAANEQSAGLVAFFNSDAKGQGYDDFFASDTVVNVTGGKASVKVYYSGEGELAVQVADGSVVTGSWEEADESGVKTLTLTAVASGSTIVTLSNEANDEKINIFVNVAN